ncbi:MAG TPA: type II toxin-antitoxin system VapB family antitoxin [Oleiagrimonas sp.]|nr:type II toxin-antitoxin system VapB family antitoxin [Oleiagrimonas sp.]
MDHTKLFYSNRSQAVRLPKAVAFPEGVSKVDIVVLGRSRLITPADDSWDVWFDGPSVSEDFMTDRDQPADQQRDAF